MLQGIMALWFVQAIVFAVFVAIDSRSTPESPVLKWGFVIVTLYSGPIGLLLYVLACREPLPGTHEAFVAPRWKQVVGSTMHCVAGDGIGILAAAVVASAMALSRPVEIAFEYAAGFLFGWMIFQALFMRDMLGGSYAKALAATFYAELVSMNGVMAGMVLITVPWMSAIGMTSPAQGIFWFIMSVGLTVGFAVAFPINWWLVANGLKHGMMTMAGSTAEPVSAPALAMAHAGHRQAGHGTEHPSARPAQAHEHQASRVTAAGRAGFALGSFVLLAIGIATGFALS